MDGLDPQWNDPLAVLRKKWGTVPSGNDSRQHSVGLLSLPDAALLAHWERAFRHDHEDFGIRGWYHELYRSFMPGKKLLDIGCGFGLSTIPFALMGARVTFVDIVATNVEVVERVCRLKGIEAEFMTIEKFADLDNLDGDYEVLTAIGSLINAPLAVIREEITYLKRRLAPGGRWLHFAYPRSRWIRDGSIPFDKWGEVTDGPGTPWVEYHDRQKIEQLFAPTPIRILFECEWHNNDFNWFDIECDGPPRQERAEVASGGGRLAAAKALLGLFSSRRSDR